MKPLNFIVLLIFCFMAGGIASAQPPNPKIRAIKIEIVSQRMSLSPEQKTKFLPLYEQYSNELLNVYRARKDCMNKPNKLEGINERQKLDQKIVDIKAKYKNDFLRTITPLQLSQMYEAEEEFKAMLIEQLKKK